MAKPPFLRPTDVGSFGHTDVEVGAGVGPHKSSPKEAQRRGRREKKLLQKLQQLLVNAEQRQKAEGFPG